MKINRKAAKRQEQNQNTAINVLSPEEIQNRIRDIEAGLKSSTWRNLEVGRKFTHNDKVSFIDDDTLIVGCDIGSEFHYIRAVDARGRELSKDIISFSNSEEGYQNAKTWMLRVAAESRKNKIVMGLEPTGHYWFNVATWMVNEGISVVQVNPYAVKQTKELEDNSQRKDDRKDPKLIANLVKDGNYGMPYIPEGLYADIRRLSMLRDQLTEDRIRNINRIHREMAIFFPEYKDAFGKIDGAFTLEILKTAPFPEDLMKLGTEGIRDIWHKAKLRGCGYSKASTIIRCAEQSVGQREGLIGSREAVCYFAGQVMELKNKLDAIEEQLHQKCREIPHTENLLEIKGIGEDILSGILSEMGDISRFDDAKEIQKLSGLGLVACSSGKHKGETRISHRGRKRLRYWLFQAAKSAVAHAEEFKVLHEYYITRENNPLKRMQSLMAIAGKILRIIFTILRTGRKYDPVRMLRDIKRPAPAMALAA